MIEWEDILSDGGGPLEDLTQGQTPSPPPYLPERPSADAWQDVIKGFTPPPPPVLPTSPQFSASAPNPSATQNQGSAESAPPPQTDKKK